jgi:cupin 2 domain-containing protein
MDIKNIFSDIPEQTPKEILETIIKSDQVKIERIISRGQATTDGDWYNQNQNEWVLILKGNAGLLFEDSEEIVIMKTGDYINIPAHKKHRVEWTDPKEETIWLAVHY